MIKTKCLTKEYQLMGSNNKKGFSKIREFFKPVINKKIAVNNLNLSIHSGEIIGFIGSNGAGKSTTLKLLTGLLLPTSGEIEVFGVNPYKNKRKLSKKIGFLMGNKSNLWWDLPLIDSFNMLRMIYDIPKNEYNQWSSYLIEMLDVASFIQTPVRQLSLGQRMRGECIATFLHQPELVYLDEPNIGLDIESKKKMNDFILNINREQNTTIILTTHDITDIQKICERMILMDKSFCIYDGAVKNFIGKYGKFKIFSLETSSKEPPTLLIDGVKLLENNAYSKEYLYDTSKYTENNIMLEISKLTHITNINFKVLDLTTVLNIYYEEYRNGN
ncbi:ABC transporter ATP-binding protein [Paenibacillus campi]|uniref:ABC transporter ATP-binding protein n=1 Tax=Paenibacillus campi TaxID=3106031 RepID=UPI002AFF1B8C|nr:ATP-binding cassette domain-containing protein [Paenibacillus sp. SGZ-1014]